jgi:hypothetical protein
MSMPYHLAKRARGESDDERAAEAIFPRRRLRVETAACLLVTACSLAIAAAVHRHYLTPSPVQVGFDEGYMVAYADRMVDGSFLPYVDGICQRGPLLYWILALAQMAAGHTPWLGIRLVGLLASLMTIGACTGIGWVLGRPWAGAIGGAFFAFAQVGALEAGGSIGVHGEQVAAPFAMAAMLCHCLALVQQRKARRSIAWMALSGAALCCAALVKQTSAAPGAAFVLSALAAGFLRRWRAGHAGEIALTPSAARSSGAHSGLWAAPPPGPLSLPLAFCAGFAIPLGLVFSLYAVRGQWAPLVYWSYSYNVEIFMQPFRRSSFVHEFLNWVWGQGSLAILGFSAFALSCAASASRVLGDRWDRMSDREIAAAVGEGLAAVQAVVVLIAAAAAIRFWPHYFLVVFPWVGLVVGFRVNRSIEAGSRLGWVPCAAVGAVLVAATAAAAGRRHDLWSHDIRVPFAAGHDPVCQLVDARSRPEDRIFVWGFDADIYVNCRRKSASRYLFLSPVAGVVAPFWNDRRNERKAPQATAELVRDLNASRPELVLDPALHLGSILEIPELRAWLAEQYCPVPVGPARRIDHAWVRRHGETCPSA